MILDQNPTTAMSSTGVDVIIRYHRPDRSLELEMALLSVFQQTYSPIHVIIVTQSFSSSELARVEEIVDAYDWDERHVSPTILSVETPVGVDARSKLLNSGLGALRQRFIAFLDFDDYLYSHAYEHLTQIAQEEDVALAFGGINVKHVGVFDNSCYNVRTVFDVFRGADMRDFVAGNFCPIHSFVVDRQKIDTNQLYVNESLTRLEDYDFLLRMALESKFSFKGLNRKVGVYNWKIDGSNSVQVFNVDAENTAINTKKWNDARRHIWRLKTRVRDRLGL